MMSRNVLRAVFVWSGLGIVASPVGAAAPAAPPAGDEKAIEIARRALDAIERGWALGAYDRADPVRASVNLRGAGLGVTANAVVDRRGRRWRLDTAGDVGPLTLLVAGGQAILHVPALAQHASRPAGALAPGASVGRSLAAEVAGMRARLGNGYEALSYRGEETIGGWRVHRIEDRPEPGVTASYWIDLETSLPRRIELARPGGRNLRVDFGYGRGPRPIRVEVLVSGQRATRLVASPAYDGVGRVKQVHLSVEPAGGGSLVADVGFDWSPRIGPEYFRFSPPAGSRPVPFNQLAQGVLFMAAGKLGALARILMEGS